MPVIRIRAAARADDAFFRQLEFETTWASVDPEDRERLTPEEVRLRLDATLETLLARDGNRIFVAEDESGARMGLLWYGVNRNLVTGEDEAWVYNVSVLPEWRGRGVGRALMEHAEALGRAGGFTTLGLMVAAHNEPAIALYQRMTFRTSTLVMRKPLG